jgi:hypothetical protein
MQVSDLSSIEKKIADDTDVKKSFDLTTNLKETEKNDGQKLKLRQGAKSKKSLFDLTDKFKMMGVI